MSYAAPPPPRHTTTNQGLLLLQLFLTTIRIRTTNICIVWAKSNPAIKSDIQTDDRDRHRQNREIIKITAADILHPSIIHPLRIQLQKPSFNHKLTTTPTITMTKAKTRKARRLQSQNSNRKLYVRDIRKSYRWVRFMVSVSRNKKIAKKYRLDKPHSIDYIPLKITGKLQLQWEAIMNGMEVRARLRTIFLQK